MVEDGIFERHVGGGVRCYCIRAFHETSSTVDPGKFENIHTYHYLYSYNVHLTCTHPRDL